MIFNHLNIYYKDLNTVKVTGKKNNVETRTGYKIAGYNP